MMSRQENKYISSCFRKVNRIFQLKQVCEQQLVKSSVLLSPLCFCIVRVTKNNLFVNLLNSVGFCTIFCFSIAQKNLWYYNANSFTFAGRLIGEYVGLIIKKLHFLWLIVRMSNINKIRRIFILGLLKYNFILLSIEDCTVVPFNGCRLKKRKR